MLGELIAEGSGRTTGLKVLSADVHSPKVEVSIQGSGTLLGMDVTALATYWQTIRAGGVLYGEGEVLFMSGDGDLATWKGFGVGRPTGPGFSASFATCGAFETESPKLVGVNSVATVAEYDVEENGDFTYQIWEWKSKAASD